jgi:nucleoside-diphosphate-sugar epimerase
MSTLVTGAAGFIGSPLVRELVMREHDVVGLIHRSSPKSLEDIADKVKFVRGSIESFPELIDIIKTHDVKYVFHTAAMLSAESEAAPPMTSININIIGTMNILEASRLMDIRRIVFTSTAAVFSGLRDINDNSMKYPFHSIYGSAKLFNELSGLWYYSKYGLDFRGVRFPNVYGRGRTKGSDAFCSQFIEKVALGHRAEIPYPEFVSDWLYVNDAVRSLIMLFNAKEPKKRVYNIAGGIHTIQEAISIVKKIIPGSDIKFAPQAKPFPFPKTTFDDTYARQELGWTPTYSLEEGIKELINETRAQTRQ